MTQTTSPSALDAIFAAAGRGASVAEYPSLAVLRTLGVFPDGTYANIVSPPMVLRFSATSGAGFADDGRTIIRLTSNPTGNGVFFNTAPAATAPTMAAFRAMLANKQDHVHVLSYDTANDGRGGIYYRDDSDASTTDNDLSCIVIGSTRWKLKVQQTNAPFDIFVRSHVNDPGDLQLALDRLPASGGQVFIPATERRDGSPNPWELTECLHLYDRSNVTIVGAGKERSITEGTNLDATARKSNMNALNQTGMLSIGVTTGGSATGDTIKNIILKDFTIRDHHADNIAGPGSQDNGHSLAVMNCDAFEMHGMQIDGSLGESVLIMNTAPVTNSGHKILNSEFRNTLGNVAALTALDYISARFIDVLVQGCLFDTVNGGMSANGDNVRILGNQLYRAGTYGFSCGEDQQMSGLVVGYNQFNEFAYNSVAGVSVAIQLFTDGTADAGGRFAEQALLIVNTFNRSVLGATTLFLIWSLGPAALIGNVCGGIIGPIVGGIRTFITLGGGASGPVDTLLQGNKLKRPNDLTANFFDRGIEFDDNPNNIIVDGGGNDIQATGGRAFCAGVNIGSPINTGGSKVTLNGSKFRGQVILSGTQLPVYNLSGEINDIPLYGSSAEGLKTSDSNTEVGIGVNDTVQFKSAPTAWVPIPTDAATAIVTSTNLNSFRPNKTYTGTISASVKVYKDTDRSVTGVVRVTQGCKITTDSSRIVSFATVGTPTLDQSELPAALSTTTCDFAGVTGGFRLAVTRPTGLNIHAKGSWKITELEDVTLPTITVGTDPKSAAWDGASTIAVCNFTSDNVHYIDTNDNILIGSPTALPGSSGALAICFGAGSYWVACNTSGKVLRITAGAVTATITVTAGPTALAYDPAHNKIWVATGSDVTIIDVATNAPTTGIVCPGVPSSVCIGNGSAWVACAAGGVNRFDLVTHARTNIASPHAATVAYDTATNKVFAGGFASADVTPINATTNAVGTPATVAFFPNATDILAGQVYTGGYGSAIVNETATATGLAYTSFTTGEGVIGLLAAAGSIWQVGTAHVFRYPVGY